MAKGHIFKINVVVPGENVEEAWKSLQESPSKYLPTEMSERIPVTMGDCTLKAVQTYGKEPELTKQQLGYAEHFGWSRNQRGWWIKPEYEFRPEDARFSVIAWGNGWAPRHSASGLLDNAAWADLRPALRVADEMFFNIEHFKKDCGLCAGCFADLPYEDIFMFEGDNYCSTGCVDL